MRFGTFAAQGWEGDQDGVPVECPVAAIVDLALLAEDSGYDSLWVYDHFHAHPVNDGIDAFRRKSAAVLAEHCCAVGRPYAEIGRTTHQMSVIGSDQTDLQRRLEIAARSCPPDEFREEHLAVTADEAVDILGEFADEGCSDVILYFYDLGESDSFEAFASDVIPQLR